MASPFTAVAEGDRQSELLTESLRFAKLSSAPGAALPDELALYYKDDHFEFVDEEGTVHKFAGPQGDVCIGAKGSVGSIKVNEVLKEDLSGATVTATGIFPAGSFRLGVAVYVVTTVTGPTSFDVGDGSDADRYANDVALTAGTQTDSGDATADPRGWASTAGDVVLTGVGGSFSAGDVRIAAFYIDYSGPTS